MRHRPQARVNFVLRGCFILAPFLFYFAQYFAKPVAVFMSSVHDLLATRLPTRSGHTSYTFAFFPRPRALNPFSETNKTYEVVRDTMKT